MDDKTIFYIVGSALALVSVAISFLGIRAKEFPPPGAIGRALIAAFSVLVVVTAAYAVLSAREEQAERREHLAETGAKAEEPTLQQVIGGADEGEEGGAEEQPAEEEPAEGEGAGDELETLGAEVFASKGCGSCHTLAAANSTGTVGPNLDETLAERDEGFIRTSILDPDADLAEGFDAVMPTFDDLSDRELDALVAFLKFSASTS